MRFAKRFFGSLKHARDTMKGGIEACIRYYNHSLLHTANGNLSPINFEKPQLKMFNMT
ncbi:hypothetical protein A0O36_01795 [Piscirickettsiaceae bacterium NZ-RLO1]|nr:hypothetical protein A0O36_01795 [Piscirickettsiaceae bacterium NZ-RLO1]